MIFRINFYFALLFLFDLHEVRKLTLPIIYEGALLVLAVPFAI